MSDQPCKTCEYLTDRLQRLERQFKDLYQRLADAHNERVAAEKAAAEAEETDHETR